MKTLKQINSESSVVWYLPHHSVTHPETPDKVRVVLDCAVKYQGTSLNANVLQGPDITNSLIGVLLKLRQENFTFIADIEAMFHQVPFDPKDVETLRFHWCSNDNLDNEPEQYSILVHLFRDGFALRITSSDNAERLQ